MFSFIQRKMFPRLIVGILAIGIFNCKEKAPATTPQEAQAVAPTRAVVLFLLGDVRYGGEKIKIGQVLEGGKVLEAFKKSYVDIQLLNSQALGVIRVRANSKFQFQSVVSDNVQKNKFFVQSGSAGFDVKKTNPDSEIRIVTPTTIAGVRGTKFNVEIKPDKTSSIELLEGKLAVRPGVESLERLPDSLVEKSAFLKEAKTSLEKSEMTLESGQKFSVSPKEVEKFSRETGLEKVLKTEEVASLLDKSETDTVSIEKAIQKIASAQSEPLKEQKIVSKVETITPKDLETKVKEFEELVKIEKEKLEKATDVSQVVGDFNKTREKQLRKKIEAIFDLPTEVLVLKDGTKIPGVLIQEGGKYIVLSPEGRKEFSADQVDSTEGLEE